MRFQVRFALLFFSLSLAARAQDHWMSTFLQTKGKVGLSHTRVPLPYFIEHAVIMLAVNYSPGEIAAAKSAAKARGEQFILLPEMTEPMKILGQASYEFEKFEHRELSDHVSVAEGMRERVDRRRLNRAGDKFRDLNEQVELATHAVKELRPLSTLLSEKIRALQKVGVGVSTLVISGHDGGGAFAGTFGETSIFSIAQIADENPEFKAGLRSAYLLGCYTATTDQAQRWKTSFPNMEIVAGYDQSAPLRDAKNGWSYLHDTMLLQGKLTAAKDVETLSALTQKIPGINHLSSAIGTYPHCEDPSRENLFYRGKVSGYKTVKYDQAMCKDAQKELIASTRLYRKYESGELPLPQNTDHSPLRELYTFFRNHEMCYQMHLAVGPHANEVLFLLFNRSVRANFSRFFSKDLTRLSEQVKKVNFKAAQIEAQKKLTVLIAKQRSLPSEFSPQDLHDLNVAKDLVKIFLRQPQIGNEAVAALKRISDPAQLQKMSMAELRKFASKSFEYQGLWGGIAGLYPFDERVESLSDNLEVLSRNFDNYIIAGRCLPFSWHETAQGMPEPPGRCDY